MNRTILIAFLLVGSFAPMRAEAEASQLGTLSFVLENDVFYNRDRHYTNGVGSIWVPNRSAPTPAWARRLAGLLPWFPDEGELRHGYAFGQSMFTPNDITVANPPLTERPYAGWLYGTFGVGRGSGKQLDLLALTLGVVGPASLAEQTQKLVHKAIGSPEPQGWSTQLGNEPGFVLNWQRSWRGLVEAKGGGVRMDLTPHVGAAAGNVFTYAYSGATLRLGEKLPNDFGPPRIQPSLLGSGEFSPAGRFDWYFFGGVEERAVARNIFLDGNTFRHSRSVEKLPWVSDLQYGFVFDWPAVRLSYTHVKRGREYRTQTGGDDFGALTVSVKF
jgi:lipid A 3-O-deacylase